MGNRKIEIGNRIRELRKQRNLSQTDLANMLGKSLRTVQKYESGEIYVSIAMINELAKHLDTTPTYLIGYERSRMQIESLSDVCSFFFELEKKDGIKFDIDVKKLKRDGEWKCSISFNAQDRTAEYNIPICSFLEHFSNYRESLETYWISMEYYEEWQNKQLAYFASAGIQDRPIKKIDERTRLTLRNKLMEEKFKPQE